MYFSRCITSAAVLCTLVAGIHPHRKRVHAHSHRGGHAGGVAKNGPHHEEGHAHGHGGDRASADLHQRRKRAHLHGGNVAKNLCIDGKLAPELILLGSARASTTLFSDNFRKSPDVDLPACLEADDRPFECPANGLKELHFFNHAERFDKGMGFWLEHYPSCPKTRRVSIDLTPAYLSLPDVVPGRIAEYYGARKVDVKFLVLMRNPLKCMHSFYYYEHQEKYRPFQAHVESVLRHRGGRYLKNVLYAPQIEAYFKEFSPSQFTIAPYRYNMAATGGMPVLSEFFWDDLGLAHPVGEGRVEESNAHSHPQVEDDLDNVTYVELQGLLDKLTGPRAVAKVFSKASAASGGGPRLYGYTGDPADAAGIEAWVAAGW